MKVEKGGHIRTADTDPARSPLVPCGTRCRSVKRERRVDQSGHMP